jgi:hypothetical protein
MVIRRAILTKGDYKFDTCLFIEETNFGTNLSK